MKPLEYEYKKIVGKKNSLIRAYVYGMLMITMTKQCNILLRIYSCKMVVGDCQQQQKIHLNNGFMLFDTTCKQGVFVILRGMMLSDGFDYLLPSFIIGNLTRSTLGMN